MRDSKNDQYIRLELVGFQEYETDEVGGRQVWDGLNHINLLIGATSSGKSRFLRRMFASRNVRFLSKFSDALGLAAVFKELQQSLSVVPGEITVWENFQRTEVEANAQPTHFISSEGDSTIAKMAQKLLHIGNLDRISSWTSTYGSNLHEYQSRAIIQSSKVAGEKLLALVPRVGLEPRIYIPSLRGLRPFPGAPDVYTRRTMSDYFQTLDSSVDRLVFTGESIYEELKKRLLTSSKSKASVAEYQKFLSDNFFDGAEVELIPEYNGDTIRIKIGKADDFPIYQVGDGIQSLIILTFEPFFAEKRCLFFIEEPDLFLHPGLQRKFIELLTFHDRFKQHQFFLTTHSNHMLDLTVDYSGISVFSFRVNEGKKLVRKVSASDRTILHEVGARSSSVFLTNCAVWVEGITDRLYLREFLDIYMSSEKLLFREDTHFAILELGGTNLVHWDFSKFSNELKENIKAIRVCSASFVLVDGDNRKGDREDTLKDALEENFHIWTLKEIENYLPEKVVREVARSFVEGSTKIKAEIKVAAIARLDQVSATDYETTPLGNYLDVKLGLKYFASDSGTLKSELKVIFCRRACELLRENHLKSLHPEVVQVCAKLATFVSTYNT